MGLLQFLPLAVCLSISNMFSYRSVTVAEGTFIVIYAPHYFKIMLVTGSVAKCLLYQLNSRNTENDI